jgi:hypothetical protein
VEEDEELQINGVVDVVYCIGMDNMEQCFGLLTSETHKLKNLPFRVGGIHFCYNNAILKPAMTVLQFLAGKYIRLRSRIHPGK